MVEAGNSLSLYDFWKRQMDIFVTLRWKVYSSGSVEGVLYWKFGRQMYSTGSLEARKDTNIYFVLINM